MKFGKLNFTLAVNDLHLVAEPVAALLQKNKSWDVEVAEIDPGVSDTAAFCEKYGVGMDVSANCVIVEAKRADRSWFVACMILATSRIDVNGIVRKHLDARKISFAPMDKAVALTGMEYGGITPIGLPADWSILVDSAVANTGRVIIGGGIRKSKLLVPGQLLGKLPNAIVMNIAKVG